MANKNNSPYEKLISKPEFNFWTPIIFTAVSITVSFMTLSNQICLNNQKLDQVIAMQEQMLCEYKDVQARLVTDELKIASLDSNQTIILKNLGIR